MSSTWWNHPLPQAQRGLGNMGRASKEVSPQRPYAIQQIIWIEYLGANLDHIIYKLGTIYFFVYIYIIMILQCTNCKYTMIHILHLTHLRQLSWRSCEGSLQQTLQCLGFLSLDVPCLEYISHRIKIFCWWCCWIIFEFIPKYVHMHLTQFAY